MSRRKPKIKEPLTTFGDLIELICSAIEIADVLGPSTIHSNSVPVEVDGQRWYDTSLLCDIERTALSYCRQRGLLKSHPAKTQLIQFVRGNGEPESRPE